MGSRSACTFPVKPDWATHWTSFVFGIGTCNFFSWTRNFLFDAHFLIYLVLCSQNNSDTYIGTETQYSLRITFITEMYLFCKKDLYQNILKDKEMTEGIFLTFFFLLFRSAGKEIELLMSKTRRVVRYKLEGPIDRHSGIFQ